MKKLLLLLMICSLLSLNGIIQGQASISAPPEEFQQMVVQDKKSAQTWWYGWIGGYTAATIGQGVVNLTSGDKSLRQDMALGAATTLLGAVGTLITPIVPGKKDMRKYGLNPDDSVHSQVYYETMLKEIAAREKAGRSWKVHAVAGVVDLGSGLITWLGFKRTLWDGVINFAMNTVIAEAQIWSQPVRAVKDYERYCREKAGVIPSAPKKPEAKMFLGSFPGGITIKVVF